MINLFPSAQENTFKDLTLLKLIHPRSNSIAHFAFHQNTKKLFEIQAVTRGSQSNGSFLVTPDLLVPKTEMRLYSEIDPFFLLLQPLLDSSPEDGPFIDYIDCMNLMIERTIERGKEGMTVLLQVLNSSGNFKSLFIENFCDHRTVVDRDLIKANRVKIVYWLRGKVELVEEYLKSSGVYLVETAGSPESFSKIAALELIRSYLSDSNIYQGLVNNLGFNTDSLFGEVEQSNQGFTTENQKPHNGAPSDAKKRQSNVSAQPSAKKLKEMAVAKNCMKMTSFFKPKQ